MHETSQHPFFKLTETEVCSGQRLLLDCTSSTCEVQILRRLMVLFHFVMKLESLQFRMTVICEVFLNQCQFTCSLFEPVGFS